MIIDKIENIFSYKVMLPNLDYGMKIVNQINDLEEGRYDFDGGYLLVQQGNTKPMDEGTFELHHKYIDVQILVNGSEEIAWADTSNLEVVIAYDEIKDAQRLDGEKSHTMLISQGMFYVAFPNEAHKPISHTKEELTYKKIVMKLAV